MTATVERSSDLHRSASLLRQALDCRTSWPAPPLDAEEHIPRWLDQERGHHEGSEHSHRGLGRGSQDSGSGSMAALTGWVLGHKRLVLGLWLVIWIAAIAALGPAGSSLSQQFNIPGTRGLRDEQGARRDLRRRRRRRADRARSDAPRGEDGRFARRARRARCGAGEGGGGAAGVDERLLCLDRRPGVRLRRWPHHVRARLHPGQGWSRPGAGGGPRGASRGRRASPLAARRSR